jgi:hypothetical protein
LTWRSIVKKRTPTLTLATLANERAGVAAKAPPKVVNNSLTKLDSKKRGLGDLWMNTDESDCGMVQKGGGEGRSKSQDVGANSEGGSGESGVPSQEGSEEKGTQRRERDPEEAQGPQGRPKRAVGRPRKAATPAASFKAATEAGRKRTAK